MLKGKWCLVTGGNRGIGQAIALAFAKEGASLILVARDEAALAGAAQACTAAGAGEVATHTVDLADPIAVDGLARDALARCGTVDVLVNNAAYSVRANSPLEGDPDEFDKMIAINLAAPMRLTRLLAPKMVEQQDGVIINMSSVYGQQPSAGWGAYSATKHGLKGWSHSCAATLRPHNVKVMCVHPGCVYTDTARKKVEEDPKLEEVVKTHLMSPEDVAETCMLAFRTSSRCCPLDVTVLETPPVQPHYP
ncbi:unnamed protein product [Ostreobium quekettii]|uniref:Short-chain dehydrogenase/reductase SDR n=1 Tax=Ostreobium quekettii TaxID=121088 RepID=A0A8S1J6C2_9CHLO|nr:unnamed protein product [Ostreobium quekettii]|eukprot:evm.model.scf_1194EXC.2 EVM.evm.TU.scf_1194EXC.2   scf_1194EXC:11591-14616(+)